ncbi:ubiquitin-associated and SH3 domain-containing protein A [Gopherus evgoodei]|uniref:Ubiquitin associated and SH3 domain containing A n=1 Tax=Gopherus evgoodei TaxID=1825980 RepID=A0A8C4XWG7_9SAUR|nr:ubiquitin-associated and SH3 domain-containing protein A [Gopherus evgoodei]XP_030433035.1 ubiquitin-associated and SH3 domain-containing protein A [Gopherus evgoodei]
MAVAETQLYSKVLNKVKNRSTCALLESLLSMGFPAHTAQKALAATGHKTAEEASKWLHSHCNDPSLDDPIPQEYALYLCPTGPLHDKLQEFWKESKNQCARNKAHEIFPHITLCDFFTCEDRKVEFLHEALKKVGDRFLNVFPPAISLSLHSSVSYLGFFINDAHANVIKEFAVAFATEASILADCRVKPCTKQLHLTLAHKFYPHHQKTLEQLAKSINPGQSCLWTAALYSRDMRFVNYQILQALFQYKPQNIDELMLNTGDLIYVDRTQQSDVSDGWVIGTSHRTGCRGFLPENYTEKANESDTWVKHREYTFTPASGLLPKNENEPRRKLNGEVHNPMTKSVTQTLAFQLSQTVALRRGLLVMRHGERVDHVFGKSWIQQCLTADGKYHRADLNFPANLPKRRDGIKHFEYDPPLSCCGVFQSRLVGEALLEKQEAVSHVYCSPALRCIQTAQHVLEGLKLEQKIKIRVEPGLFEWMKWEANKIIPSFMALTELTEATYNIDPSYRCTFPLSSLVPSESYEEYVSRCSAVVKQIVSDCTSNGIILIVGHGSSLDSFTRPVLGLPARDSNDFASLVRKIPSLGVCFCEELKEENRWQMINPPVKTLTHGSNAAFNWRNGILDS